MILGIGIDLVAVSRVESMVEKFGINFEKRIFTDFELDVAKKKNNDKIRGLYFAKRFAVKEAFSKAVGCGIGSKVSFLDIEVDNDVNGKPFIRLLNGKEEFFCKFFDVSGLRIDVSISDELDMAQAMVVISNN